MVNVFDLDCTPMPDDMHDFNEPITLSTSDVAKSWSTEYLAERVRELELQLDEAREANRGLARRLVKLQHMISRQTLDEAIGLYLEFKNVHGYEEQRARFAAVQEVLDGIDALDEIAAYEAEYEPHPHPDPAPARA